MVQTSLKKLTLEEFLTSPQSNGRYELIDGAAIPKMSPKYFHAASQLQLLFQLKQWSQESGRVVPEWAIILQRQGKDWVPDPDLLYISYEQLPADWQHNEACPLPPELAIEIVSPGQNFGQLAEKAADYLTASVLRVWIVDPIAKSITVFAPNAVPITYRNNRILTDPLLPDLELIPQQLFQQAGLP